MSSKFDGLSPESRVWIFYSTEELQPGQQASLLSDVGRFVASWKAHGQSVDGTVEVLFGHFLLVAALPSAASPSGCSIDSLFHAVREAASATGARLETGPGLFYRDGDVVHSVSEQEFLARIEDGTITEDTVVFNNSVRTLADVQQGRWQVAFAKSWHARSYPLPA